MQNPGRFSGLALGSVVGWLRRVVAELAPEARSFTVRLVGERAMAELNSRYRGRAASTDVLSFAGERGPEGWHLGDVVIAVPVLREQAAAVGHAASAELRILLLHGVLHCLGYDHERDSGEMEHLETRLRRRYLERSGR